MLWEFDAVTDAYGHTEGPVWDGSGVVFSDMANGTIRRFDAETGDCEVLYDRTDVGNGLKLDASGSLYVCEMRGRRLARYGEEGRETVVDHYDGARLNGPNDLAFDDHGRIWFTDPFYDVPFGPDPAALDLDHRSVYRVDPRDPATLTRMTTDTRNPNGLLLSPAGDRLYVAEYEPDGRNDLRAYPIEGDAVGEPEVLHDFAPHRGTDGMCLDADGNVVATAGSTRAGPGPRLCVFAPSGRLLETHPVPDPFPTNCCFGGPDLRTIYLTGGDGCLYQANTNRTGYLGAP